MNFTFGIITGGGQEERIKKIVDSIYKLNIPFYEIIVIGSCNLVLPNLRVYEFDETVKPRGWITRKKNLITEYATYDNIVYSHDYVSFNEDFYTGWLKYGDNYNACMNRIIQTDGERFPDWLLWIPKCAEVYLPELINTASGLLPYECLNLSKIMYFSGTYFVAKKKIMEEIPLNNDLVWAQGEDVEWSYRYKEKYNFSLNTHSSVTLLKPKTNYYNSITDTALHSLQESFCIKKQTQSYKELYDWLITL